MVAYGSVDQLVKRMEFNEEELTLDQEEVYSEILEAISEKIDLFCDRPSGFAAAAADGIKYLEGNGSRVLRIPECVEITTVSVKSSYTETTYTDWATPTTPWAGDGDWYPAAGSAEEPIFNRTPYTHIFLDPNGDYSVFPKGFTVPTVKITGRWGFAVDVPATVREACLAQAVVLIKRFAGVMDDRLSYGDLGVISIKVRQAALSRDIKELLVDTGWALPLYAGGL